MDGWATETITVVTKTYPECSKKYGCLVCIAGMNTVGQWRRLYPIPWALFWKGQLKFQKWDVISLPTRRKVQDHRNESYEVSPATLDRELKVVRHIDGWDERRKFLEPHLDVDLEWLGHTKRSLGLVKPKEIKEFLLQDRQRISDPAEIDVVEKMEVAHQQLLGDWEPELIKKSRTPPQALPWLGYEFTCHGINCHGHKMMCIDWEIQELYRSGVKKEGETIGFDKTRQKAMWMADRDLYFVVGTTWRFPSWMIVGLFYPPRAS
jgi:hypothetical protein